MKPYLSDEAIVLVVTKLGALNLIYSPSDKVTPEIVYVGLPSAPVSEFILQLVVISVIFLSSSLAIILSAYFSGVYVLVYTIFA